MIVLETIQLAKVYGTGEATTRAVWDVNLKVLRGEFVSIVGPSGSGKSTLLGLLGGLDRPSSGTILLEGRDMDPMTEDQRAVLRRRRIGFVFQRMNLLPDFTAVENVALPLTLDSVATQESRERAIEVLEKLGMGHRLNSFPATLSGGEQQRVAIARPW